MTQKKLNEHELQEILELAKEAKVKAKEMCKIITTHGAKSQRLHEEAKIKLVQ